MNGYCMANLLRTNTYPKIPKALAPTLSDDTLFAINDFLRAKTGVYTKETLYRYLRFLARALSQIDIRSLEDITKINIRDWMNVYLIDKSKKTQHNYISILAAFFRHCLKRGLIRKFPITKRCRVTPSHSQVRNLDEHDYSKVKKMAELLPLQHRAIIEFLDSTGARCSELIYIKVSDIDFTSLTANVVGKGGKPRKVKFSEECSYLLKELIENRESAHDYVFVSPTGSNIYHTYIWRIVSMLGRNAGVKGTLFPHRYRHTKASKEFANGTSLLNVSKMLGHSTVVTTMIYIHFVSADIQSDYERAMNNHE